MESIIVIKYPLRVYLYYLSIDILKGKKTIDNYLNKLKGNIERFKGVLQLAIQ